MASFTEILQSLQSKASASLQGDSMKWYVDQIRKMAKLTKLRIQEYAEAAKNKLSTPSNESDLETSETKRFSIDGIPQGSIIDEKDYVEKSLLGKMVLYRYDPKWKKELPYYDTFPLGIPITYIGPGRFHSLNLHYLQPYERAELLDALMKINNLHELDDYSKMILSYDILKSASQLRSYKPCFKEYITSHIQSAVFVIKPTEWENVITLPLAQFQKASQYAVWRDSIRMIYK